MGLKTNLKRNKLVRAVRECLDPQLKERRQHYDSWVRNYKFHKNHTVIKVAGRYGIIHGNKLIVVELKPGHIVRNDMLGIKE